MSSCNYAVFPLAASLVGVVCLLVGSEWEVSAFPGFVVHLMGELTKSLRFTGASQAIPVVAAGAVFLLVVCELFWAGGRRGDWHGRWALLLGVCGAILVSWTHGEQGYPTRSFLVLLIGVALGHSARSLYLLLDELRWRLAYLGIWIAVLFASGVFLAFSTEHWISRYRFDGQLRESGLVADPNSFGIFLGLQLVCAVGLLRVCVLTPFASGYRQRVAQVGLTVVMLGWIAWSAQHLVATYSRGAWLATMVGLLSLTYACRAPNRRVIQPLATIAVANPRFLSGRWLVLLCAVSGLFFAGAVFPAQANLQNRIVGSFRAGDGSVQNRIIAWRTAGIMLKDEPLGGFGWAAMLPSMEEYYQPEDLPDVAAVRTNSYLELALCSGLPVAIGFVFYIGRALRPRDQGWPGALTAVGSADATARLKELQGVFRAVALVAAVAFALNGKLFSLSLGIPFWIALELGNAEPGQDCRMQPDSELFRRHENSN